MGESGNIGDMGLSLVGRSGRGNGFFHVCHEEQYCPKRGVLVSPQSDGGGPSPILPL